MRKQVVRLTSFLPKAPWRSRWFDLLVGQPRAFISKLMQLTMMFSAHRDGELITYLAADRDRLRKLDAGGPPSKLASSEEFESAFVGFSERTARLSLSS
jgi:hypothetical protein